MPPERRGPRWWWEFHEFIATAAYLTLLVPLWLVHTWTPGTSGLVLFLSGLASAVVASILRLHLVFAVRSYPTEWAHLRQSSARWILLADLVFGLVLLVGGGFVLNVHASAAAVLVGSSVAVLASAVVIEPATTRAAFGEQR